MLPYVDIIIVDFLFKNATLRLNEELPAKEKSSLPVSFSNHGRHIGLAIDSAGLSLKIGTGSFRRISAMSFFRGV